MKNNLIKVCVSMTIRSLIICIWVFSNFALANEVKAQDLKKVHLSIHVEDESLEKVVKQIQNQTVFTFFYEDGLISKNNYKVSLSADNASLKTILNEIASQLNLSYKQTNNTIALKKVIPKAKENKQSYLELPQAAISGTVSDKAGPLPGVNIVIKGTTTGTQTDFDGNYSLTNVPNDATLVFSYIGFVTQEVKVNNKTTINLTMREDAQALDEVVVVGYGTVKKSDLTGSVASVKVGDFSKGVTTSVDGMLNGVSGLNVVQNNGAPGGSFSINIRGASSVSAGNGPLYVIDGFPVDNRPALGSGGDPGFSGSRSPTNPLASINPQDIESIEILKDASAAAIYGSRGANGVVMITTKSGKAGKAKVSIESSYGYQTPFNRLDLLSAQDYKRVLNQIIEEGGGSQGEIVGDIANGGEGTDWQDEISHDMALMQNQQISFSGGTESSKYFLSLNYQDQDGIVKSTDFKRYGLRLNLDSQITDKFKVGLSSTISYTENTYVPNGFSTNENSGALYAAINFDPTLSVYDEDGNYTLSPFLSIDNPVALIDGTSSEARSSRVLTTVNGEYSITPDLNAKLTIGGDILNEKRENYISRITKNGRNNGGIGSNYQGERSSYLVEATMNYKKEFGKHFIEALAGTSFQRFSSSRINIRASDFPSDATGADNLALGNPDNYTINNPSTGNKLASLIGRANYRYNNKYSATFTVRRDGSSRFGDNNKYGTFPSAALAWKISEENFLKNSNVLSFLKLRTSWGLTGNQEIGDFAYQTTYNGGNPAVWDGELVTSTQPVRLPNPDLKWEQTEQIDIGIDFGFFGNRLNGGIDYYRKNTSDMLLNLPVPQSTGFGSILTNIGEIRNSGIDFSINSKNFVGEGFQWDTNITITTLKNEVVDLGGIPEINSGSTFLHVDQIGIIRPGEPLNSFYGWEVEGIWQEGDDFSTTNENVQPGSMKYKDQNGDGSIDGDDRVILGNSFPDLQWSLGNTFRYKNFELFVYMTGVEGAEMLNGNLIDSYYPINFRRNKFAEPYLNRWTPENPSNEYPSFVDPLSQGRRTVNSKTVQDASYIKLRNIRISYNFPESVSWLPSGQVYFSADNIFVITDYDGIDPAINPNNNATLRVDFNPYPTTRTYLLGFRLDL